MYKVVDYKILPNHYHIKKKMKNLNNNIHFIYLNKILLYYLIVYNYFNFLMIYNKVLNLLNITLLLL
jgi:hypothetical protein